MITADGRQYGTAAEIAERLGPDVTAQRVRDWIRRGLLTRIGGRIRLDQAAEVERRTRTSTRGRKRTA